MQVSWKIDRRKLCDAQVHKACEKALDDAAEALLSNANQRVPIETATLERSGTVSNDFPRLKAMVSYNTPYARRQHEDLSLKHDPGRNAKWLENAVKAMQPRFAQYLQSRLKGL